MRFGAAVATDLSRKQTLDLFSLHRMRALPGRLPRLGHREAAQPRSS